MGHEVVLWTTRNGDELTAAVEWCDDRGLHFCSVNEAAPSNMAEFEGKYPTPSRKIYADVYIDDHNVEYIGVGRESGYVNMVKYIKNLKGRQK